MTNTFEQSSIIRDRISFLRVHDNFINFIRYKVKGAILARTYLRCAKFRSKKKEEKRKEELTRGAVRGFANLYARQANFIFRRDFIALNMFYFKSYLLNIDLRAAFIYLSRVVPILLVRSDLKE